MNVIRDFFTELMKVIKNLVVYKQLMVKYLMSIVLLEIYKDRYRSRAVNKKTYYIFTCIKFSGRAVCKGLSANVWLQGQGYELPGF